MTLKNTDDRWGAVSQLFHWVIVVLILVMAYLGLTMVGMWVLGLLAVLGPAWRAAAVPPAIATRTA